MNKLLALAIVAGCYTYAEPGSARFVQALLLPGLGLAALVYLQGLPAALFIGIGTLMLSQIDLFSQALFTSLILPLLLLLCCCLFLYWAWPSGHFRGGDWGDGDCGGGNGSGD
ncbi:MAG TPA: hypothetical protein VIS52_07500 [Motiliproteus sp.]